MTEPKRKLTIDLNELALAFDSGSVEVSYYLDIETGDVLMVTEETQSALETILNKLKRGATLVSVLAAIEDSAMHDWQKEALREAAHIELETELRYLAVPCISSREGYQDMEAFIETVEDEHVRDMLYVAIDGRGAFGRFKGMLARHPEVGDRWYQFKDAQLRQRVLEWLADEGIEAE